MEIHLNIPSVVKKLWHIRTCYDRGRSIGGDKAQVFSAINDLKNRIPEINNRGISIPILSQTIMSMVDNSKLYTL